MMQKLFFDLCVFASIAVVGYFVIQRLVQSRVEESGAREVVVFWHFWGGADAEVVSDVVDRFNASQEQYEVRAIAMPGNNLNAKLFLSITGGDPPDLINQDDPVVADWGKRGAIVSFDSFVDANELSSVRQWMYPAARKLCDFDDRTFAICNGLDIRALYYNKTEMERLGFSPPETIEELDQIAKSYAAFDTDNKYESYAYLPDSRRLQAWAYVFGGEFVNSAGDATIDLPANQKALEWMTSYARAYGPENVAAFRAGDQSLPGKTFPLLPINDDQTLGRYLMILDGQWRTRDIAAFQKRRAEENLPPVEFGVCPLPYPEQMGRKNAGWVNGNFFVVPNGASNKLGAWEFAKFWIGYQQEHQAALTCRRGGWIPVSANVTEHSIFQEFLIDHPLFKRFVDLAKSENQYPTPRVVGAAFFDRTLKTMTAKAMNDPDQPAKEWLEETDRRVQSFFDRVK